jgi:putative heme-binding domain-containing protein
VPLRAEPPDPDWIWKSDGDRHGGEAFESSKTFALTATVRRGVLRATADFARVRVDLNGTEVLVLDPYDPPVEIEVTRRLVPGENRILIAAEGTGGPSALGATLELVTEQGGALSVVRTDASWPGAASFGPIEPTRWALNRLPEVSPFAEYNQWREALDSPEAAKLSPLPAGFEIKKIRDAAEGEDSWVSLAFDAKGALYLGKEQKGILRLSLSDQGDEVVEAVTVEDTLRECRGLVWKGDTLYAHANNDKALYALRDANGDGRFAGEEVVLVQATEGGAGHGRNALTVHEGTLHGIVGDNIAVPPGAPRRARPEAGAPEELGHSIRIGLDDAGQVRWEAQNRGLRNPYGIAFNAEGEAFTYDADNEGDVGLPFYRPSRINHLVSGANYGWHQDRGNTRSLPVYAPDSVPTTYDVGRGSPTGVRFGTRSHFPPPWRDALFALDWAYGRILAIHFTPNGAGYHARGEVFLEGRPLNVTDLDFDDEGAMWFVTGGRKTKSALYRIRQTVGKRGGSPGRTDQESERIRFSEGVRDLRRKLERFHGQTDATAVGEAWPHLGSPDPWLRNAARVAVEWQPVAEWRDRALGGGNDLAGLTALLALARAGSDEDRAAVAKRAAQVALDEGAFRIEKLTLLRIHELAGVPDRAAVAAQLAPLKTDPSGPVQRELARALIRIEAPGAVPYAMERLASSVEQMDRLHYLEALSEAGAGWERGQREVFFTALAHARRFSYGDRFMQPFFQTLEETALARVTDEAENGRLAALLKAGPETEEPVPAPRPMVKHWTLDELAAAPAPGGKPDPARGRELYAAVLCSKCHVCGTTGRAAGPDLTMVASRFSRRDLLESILEPSAVVAEVHRNVVVAKNDGSTVMGRIVQNDFRESKLTLATNPFAPSELVTIPKAEIKTWEESPVSPMPPALLDTLTREEVEDLLGFLLAGGKIPEDAP